MDAAIVAALWDFSDPAGSLTRFEQAADHAQGEHRVEDALVWRTQAARAHGLLGDLTRAHRVLDDVVVAAGGPEVEVRVLLERGRLHRSADDPAAAAPLFHEAATTARGAGLVGLEVDALHMVALVAPAEERIPATQRALAVALDTEDPDAWRWEASLRHNLGLALAEVDRWPEALEAFTAALALRERGEDVGATRVARWMVGWALRHLGRPAQARQVQEALRAELDDAGEHDPHVEEELALLAEAEAAAGGGDQPRT